MRNLLLLAVITASCSPAVEPGFGAIISCDETAECPPEWTCADLSSRCVPDGQVDETGPFLLQPVDGALLPAGELLLVWSSVIGGDSYTVQISPDVTFNTGVEERSGAFTSATITLPAVGTYYWRVWANTTVVPAAELGVGRFELFDAVLRVYCPATGDCAESAGPEVGTVALPFRSISRALAASADPDRGATEVLVAGRGGDAAYSDSIAVRSGVDILGGYDPTFEVRDPVATPAVVENDTIEVLTAIDIAAPTEVSGLTLRAIGGGNQVAVLLQRDTQDLTLRECVISSSRNDDLRWIEVMAIIGTDPGPSVENNRIECRDDNCYAITFIAGGASIIGNTIVVTDPFPVLFKGISGADGGPYYVRDNIIMVDADTEAVGVDAELSGIDLGADAFVPSELTGNRIHLRATRGGLITGIKAQNANNAAITLEKNDVRIVSGGPASDCMGLQLIQDTNSFSNVVVVAGCENRLVGVGVAGGLQTRVVHNLVILDGAVEVNGGSVKNLLGIDFYGAGVVNNLFINVGAPAVSVAGGLMGCFGTEPAIPGSLVSNVFVGSVRFRFEDSCAATTTAFLSDFDEVPTVWWGDTIQPTAMVTDNLTPADTPAELLTGPILPDEATDWITVDLHPLLTYSGDDTSQDFCGPVHPNLPIPYDCGTVLTDIDGAPRELLSPAIGAYAQP